MLNKHWVWIAATVAGCTGPAPAADPGWWGVATIASYHANRDVKHNEQNWGIGIEREATSTWRWAAGGYRNSYWRDSLYMGGFWMPEQYGHWKFGALIALATGYDRVIGPFTFYMIPTVMYETKTWGANLAVLPSIERGIGILGLQGKVSFR